MASRGRNHLSGFSLVELLVAVLFIGILMAGMANVFKASVTTLTTSSEGISSARRNRMSIDLLYDDLNSAGMYLVDLASPPVLSTNNPSFYILPNMAVAGAAADDPQTADEVYFYLDQALAFEGTLAGTGGGVGTNTARSAAEQIMAGTPTVLADTTYAIECNDASYANMVKVGQAVVIKDSFETFNIATVTVTGTRVIFTVNASPNVAMTGEGASGGPSKTKHLLSSGVVLYLPAQMVKYSLQMQLTDPQRPAGVPCLVRDQGVYSTAGFVADPAQRSIIAENVSGFKVYLRSDLDPTKSWVGYGKTYSGFANGWTAGMRADLNTQLAGAGRPGFTTTAGNENWIRDIPVLIRLDISTRTSVKRAEYSATPLTTTAFKDFTQSLVIVPRHFGLSMK